MFAKAIENRIVLSENDFNHCSTVAPIGEGVAVAFYSGSGECQSDQKVSILYIKDGQTVYKKSLEEGTGNPVLWKSKDHVILMYSKFEDDGPIVRLIDKWKYCSLWTVKITEQDGKLHVENPKKINTLPHLLGRCPPLRLGSELLLPLYDEVDRSCFIHKIKEDECGEIKNIEPLCVFGQMMIQPTLWLEKDMCFALCRNFGNNEIFSYVFASEDAGESWTGPIKSDIPNNNSSLAVAVHKDAPYMLWNDTILRERMNLCLGKMVSVVNPLVQGATIVGMHLSKYDYGAYPTLISDGDFLRFTFTNGNHEIEYHEWNTTKLKRASKAAHNQYRRDVAGDQDRINKAITK